MTSVFKLTPVENQVIQEYRDKAITELNKWFNKNWVINTPKIFIIDDRKTIDLLKEQKSENWLVGWSTGIFGIYLLNPENISTESDQDQKTYNIEKLIKHELCHSFFNLTFGQCKFAWVNEGVSIYVANQFDLYPTPKELNGFLDEKKIYKESGTAIKLLIDNFGKDNLFDFLKKQSGTRDIETLSTIFEEVYNNKLNYDFFNKLLQNGQ